MLQDQKSAFLLPRCVLSVAANRIFRFAVTASALLAIESMAETEKFALPRMPAEQRTLVERFADPPPSARILRIIHNQSDDPQRQNQILTQLADQGFGGFAGNVSFKGYVEDPTKWPPFVRSVQLAKDAGMTLWLYDEQGYPSGSAGDLTLRGHPEWAARGLLIAQTNSCGGAVTLKLPPGDPVAAVALPVRGDVVAIEDSIDLQNNITAGVLRWQAPAGEWFVTVMTDDLIYENTHAAISLAFKKPCINLLMPEPTARFLEVTHERYARHLGRDLGKYFAATFTDEPSLQSYWFHPMPYRVLPWSDNLPGAFAERHGVELLPLLPALVANAGAQGARVRCMFWDTVAELVSENYFGQIQSWCRKHNLPSGGHLLMEESLVSHVSFYGDLFRCLRRMDAPGIDCLSSLPFEVSWDVARLARSAADLRERNLVMCEVSDHKQHYRKADDKRQVVTVTEDQIRGSCHRLLWGGITTLTSYYSFKNLNDQQLRRLNTEIGRCSTMLAGGYALCDIAVLYPIESLWPKFAPAHRGATAEADAYRIERVFDTVGPELYQADREFNYIDSRALLDASVKNKELWHNKLRWRVLVLPMCDTLPLQAWRRIHEFWRRGGVVIAAGARPLNSIEQWPSKEVAALGATMFGDREGFASVRNRSGGVGIYLPPSMISLVPQMVDCVLERAAWSQEPDAPIRITQRIVDDHAVYFVINDSADEWHGTLCFNSQGVREKWNPITGRMTPLMNKNRVDLKLGAYRAMLFRADEPATAARLELPVEIDSVLQCVALPVVEPRAGYGEFVNAQIRGDAENGWRAAARLKKGGVDTHLFMGFNYSDPLDLSGSAGLVIDAAVPEGQSTSAEMLVFLETVDGMRYLASSGRFLNEAGEKRAYVLFSQFRMFGEKGRTRGVRLNPVRVKAVRVGWGGYFGEKGEEIIMTLKPPHIFKTIAEP
jgi:hypothetical protein